MVEILEEVGEPETEQDTALADMLNLRVEEFLADPSTASPWDDVKKRARASRP